MRQMLPLGLVLGIAVIWSAGGASSGQASDASAASPAAVVKMSDFKFSPKTITIDPGQTVEWRNTSILSWHTATCDPKLAKHAASVSLPVGAKPFSSGKVKAGRTYSHTFDTPGTYHYFCIPHESMGMVGDVVVRQK